MSISMQVESALAQAQPYIGQWGLWAVGVGILAKKLPLVGVWVPGFSILMAAGFLTAAGALPAAGVLCVAFAGSVLGDQVCYLLGRWAGEPLLRRHARAAERVRRALASEGALLLLWYHFVSPLRVTTPLLCGSAGYPLPRWLLFNSLGGAIWVGFGFALGYVAYGPLKRFGDVGYYAVFTLIGLMILTALWRLARMFRRSGAASGSAE